MMRTPLAVALVLLSVGLSGCAEDAQSIALDSLDASPDGDPPRRSYNGTQGQDPAGGDDGNATEDGNSTEAQAPTAHLTVAVNGTNATFTVDAEDPDDDLVSWAITFGDGNATNGTSFPATFNHTYGPGNFSANLTVVDAAGQYATASVNVTVGGGAEAEPAAPVFPWSETKLTAVMCATCIPTADGCAGFLAGAIGPQSVSGADCAIFELPAGSPGRAFTATSNFPVPDPDGSFFKTCEGGYIEKHASEGPESGTVPEGAGCFVVWEFVGAASSITVTIE